MEYYLKGGVAVFVTDELPEHINIQNVLKRIAYVMPAHIIGLVDAIYVGQNSEILLPRQITSVFLDGAIYVSNDQYDEAGFIADIVHEMAHAIEAQHGLAIYGDGRLENEFLSKRIQVCQYLHDHTPTREQMIFWADPEYNAKFDTHLYQELGYPLLGNISNGIFVSPYAITSLREYWANGVEEFCMRDRAYLSKICPVLAQKIKAVFFDNDI